MASAPKVLERKAAMNRVGLTGLCKIELPADTILLSDGGFTEFDGDTYLSRHPVFGTIGGVKELTEGIGDEVPALELTLLPAPDALPGDVTQPGFQRSRVRFWIAEFASSRATDEIATSRSVFFVSLQLVYFITASFQVVPKRWRRSKASFCSRSGDGAFPAGLASRGYAVADRHRRRDQGFPQNRARGARGAHRNAFRRDVADRRN